jgi:hypothetical protein
MDSEDYTRRRAEALKQYRAGLLTYEEALKPWLQAGGTIRSFELATGIPWERPAK